MYFLRDFCVFVLKILVFLVQIICFSNACYSTTLLHSGLRSSWDEQRKFQYQFNKVINAYPEYKPDETFFHVLLTRAKKPASCINQYSSRYLEIAIAIRLSVSDFPGSFTGPVYGFEKRILGTTDEGGFVMHSIATTLESFFAETDSKFADCFFVASCQDARQLQHIFDRSEQNTNPEAITYKCLVIMIAHMCLKVIECLPPGSPNRASRAIIDKAQNDFSEITKKYNNIVAIPASTKPEEEIVQVLWPLILEPLLGPSPLAARLGAASGYAPFQAAAGPIHGAPPPPALRFPALGPLLGSSPLAARLGAAPGYPSFQVAAGLESGILPKPAPPQTMPRSGPLLGLSPLTAGRGATSGYAHFQTTIGIMYEAPPPPQMSTLPIVRSAHALSQTTAETSRHMQTGTQFHPIPPSIGSDATQKRSIPQTEPVSLLVPPLAEKLPHAQQGAEGHEQKEDVPASVSVVLTTPSLSSTQLEKERPEQKEKGPDDPISLSDILTTPELPHAQQEVEKHGQKEGKEDPASLSIPLTATISPVTRPEDGSPECAVKETDDSALPVESPLFPETPPNHLDKSDSVQTGKRAIKQVEFRTERQRQTGSERFESSSSGDLPPPLSPKPKPKPKQGLFSSIVGRFRWRPLPVEEDDPPSNPEPRQQYQTRSVTYQSILDAQIPRKQIEFEPPKSTEKKDKPAPKPKLKARPKQQATPKKTAKTKKEEY